MGNGVHGAIDLTANHNRQTMASACKKDVMIPVGKVTLEGELILPAGAKALIIFSHGSGSSRTLQRNKWIASCLRKKGFGTLLFDLLTKEEDNYYSNRFEIDLLSRRLLAATTWIREIPEAAGLGIGFFGAGTGTAAALEASTLLETFAVVSRSGRPDLAFSFLHQVSVPTLFIVGSKDQEMLDLHERCLHKLDCPNALHVVEGASHQFKEEGMIEDVVNMSINWFDEKLHSHA